MRKKQRFETHNLFAKLGDCGSQSVVFCAEDLDLLLQVGKPLLFPLPAFESSDSVV